jgi:hypothetical protein
MYVQRAHSRNDIDGSNLRSRWKQVRALFMVAPRIRTPPARA